MWSKHVIIAFILCGLLSINAIDTTHRPSYHEYAKMARYLVHKSNWTSMGTISSMTTIQGFPMVNVKSIADSPLNEPSTGHIYFLLTDLDLTAIDLKINNKLTAMFTEDQDLSCTSQGIDTMEPTCARVIFTGSLEKLTPNTDEYYRADEAYTNRHPASINWRKTHTFYLCQLRIEQIAVLDFYGGAHYVTVNDYFNADYDAQANEIDAIQPSVIRPNWL